ncbi:IgGFc-binding protein [Danio aesculapii]|uniref:IgGFc-binding protein n=1 Tax=Danio aesculapii TaxID=1142201 RepID=UPI0024C048EA|nr:IgGFc-binding protein [Danio aesculapii]
MGANLLPVCVVIFLFWDGTHARSAGQEFATAFMQNYVSPFDLPLFQLYITCLNNNCLVKVFIPGLRFTQEVQLTKGQGITVTLPNEVELSGTKRSRNTVSIQSSEDVTVSSLNSKQYTADTSLVYPLSEWGTEYFVFTPTNSPPSMLKEFVIVNGKDQNTVEVFLRAAVRFEGRLYAVGSKLVVVLEPFENVQIQSQGDLTGTRISSQLPIAVYSGHMCTWWFSKCNHVYEQLLPVQGWGTQYLVAPLSIQTQFDSIYIQASQSTNITIQFGRTSLTNVLQRGLILEYKIQFPDGLNIMADSGIQVLFLFNGVRTSSGIIYDPFLVNVQPINRFCTSYAVDGIAGFGNRALLIVPTSEQAGMRFDSSSLPGNLQWRVIKNSNYSWTELIYQTGAGQHKITHPSTSFGIYSVGFDQANGYGAPAPCIDPVGLASPRSCFGIICNEDEECMMKDSSPVCVKKPLGICWAMGDPHYSTFDQRYFDFMGTCTYVVTKNCQKNDSLPAFEVLAKNENRGDTRVSYVAQVTVHIGGITISVESSKPGKVQIDQILWSLPVILDDVGVNIFQSGSFISILFSFGLNVQYDWSHYLMVSLPTVFMNKVCGLCGNFNGDPADDFTMPSNTQAPNSTAFGQSWKVLNLTLDKGCRDDNGGHECDAQALQQWQTENYCGLLMKDPFSQCHSVIDPNIYIRNCVYDVCLADGSGSYLCKALEVYASVCQRVGIQLTKWREVANCTYRCPENSHYESCGSACPLTCMDLKSHKNCTLPCIETCTCDPGFVLSGSKCVASTQCGCSYNGRYVPAGETFWADNACQRLCHCSVEGGLLECQDASCGAGLRCEVVNGITGCYPFLQSTCMALGDPHYYTFDGKFFDFQGSCVYQLAGVCVSAPGLVPFNVLVQNEFRGSKVVTFTKLLEIKVYNISIVIDREYAGFVTVNGVLLNLPFNLLQGQVSVFRSGFYAVVQTSFGLKVTFDWNSFATVTVPSTYMGAVCGLCGNYNGNPEDDLAVKGTTSLAYGAMEFGASWLVAQIPGCAHGCTDNCQTCDPSKMSLYGTSDYCGLLRDPQGPFRNCHTVLNPGAFFEDCVYDVCLYEGRRDILCQAITAYASSCQAMGKTISPWRSAEFCGVQCPLHSHYELCGSGCEVTCESLAPPAGCRSLCMEGCVCDQGFIRSGDRCVPLAQCGCVYESRYYLLYQKFYPGNSCEEMCTCSPDSQVVCNKISCGPFEKCELVDGVQKCQPIGKAICQASGDPHYVTFDGRLFDFQGTCRYILAQSCGVDWSNLTSFSIQVENERWTPNRVYKVSVTKQVAVILYGSTFVLRQNQPQISVNGVLTNLPYSSNSLNGSLVRAYKDGVNYIIETGFGLKVTYDLVYYVTVTVPGNYRNKTCGLCGIFDGNPSNDFQLPDGNITNDPNIFGRAWKVDIPGSVCEEDGCVTGACLNCDPQLKAIFEKPPYCGVLIDPNGPFSACHAMLNPSAYLKDCVFDTCVSGGSSKVVCDSVARYAINCHTAGVSIQNWRTDSFCPMLCPAHSHYELCSDVCSAACPGLTSIIQCPKTCTEGCACDGGFLFNGQICVEHQQCGCYEQGRTFKAGEVVYLNYCEQKCQCDPGTGLTCEKSSCPNGTECLLRDGVWNCSYQDPCKNIRCREKETCTVESGRAVCMPLYRSSCWAWGDPHYNTFDGYDYDFQGTCRYVLSKTCGLLSGLEPFSVTQSNENRGSPAVSFVQEVEVIVYGNTLTLVNHQMAQIMVDGLLFYLPLDLHDGRVRVRQSGTAALLETDFGLSVSYDWNSKVILQLPSSYYGLVCGLCGNFNNNNADELRDPTGNLLPGVYQWAKSWRAENSSTSTCQDGCDTNCPVCPPELLALYKTDTFCGVLTSAGQSVFNVCYAKVNPQAFQQSCVFDLCSNNGDRRLLCQALETYVQRCRQEGVIITDWRKKYNCSISCPPNSHYEARTSPYAVTCSYPDQPQNCTDTCVEACVCDSGFVLSADTCVPTNQCGCSFEGVYYQPGQTFWADNQCLRLCECNRNLSVVVCRESSCPVGERCSVVDGKCKCQPMSTGECVASGDPHYRTFDGLRFDFQGTCVYQLAALCVDKEGLVPFNVTVQNDHLWGNAVSFTKTVNVSVNGFSITMTREHPNQILVDGQLADLPFLLKGILIVFRSGNTALLKTKFGLQVTFDWSSMTRVTLPSNYSSAVCGLCGNFNSDVQDDFVMRNGTRAPNSSSLGQSWQVSTKPDCSSGGCLGTGCSSCPSTQRENAERYCEIIANQTGPFKECHTYIDPGPYEEDCILDTCQFQGYQGVLCSAVAAYASACQSQSITVYQWRNATFCPLSCPPNSHYNSCSPGCTETCAQLSEHNCTRPCAEACQCDHGFIWSGQTCVPQTECGCFYQGRYYKKHQVFYNHPQCMQLCMCGDNGNVSCQTSSCGPGEACGIVDGVFGCHPVSFGQCVATGDPHYISFDGRRFDFQGTCVYTLAKVCEWSVGQLRSFSVDTQNEQFGNRGVSVIRSLTVNVYNFTITIRRGERWRVIVNNEFVNLPSSLDQVTISQVGFNVIIQTDFGLRVQYDTSYHAEVHIPSNYQNSTCGLCGNYNGNPSDDFMLPNGTQSSSAETFGQAWALKTTGVQCVGGSSPKQCIQSETDRYRRDDACGLMASATGPFSACHDLVNPEPHVINCVFDMCVMNGDRETLCQNLQGYAIICQQAGIQIMPWRNSSFCPADCPANSHYVQCSNNCAKTCASLTASINSCPNICMEGCQCDEGFLSDGDQCVSVGDCGCVHNGKYLKVGEVSVTETCNMKCFCRAAGVLECVKLACASEDTCDVQNGKRDCYPLQGLCAFDTNDQLLSFDGVKGTIGQLGAFQMAFLCDEQSPDWFRVVLDIHACARNQSGNMKIVHVFFQDMIITVNNRLHSWVNGKNISYPFIPKKGLSVSFRNEAVIIEKMSTLRLTYSVAEGVALTISTDLRGNVCGACGNFNGDSADDMTISAGRNSTVMSLDVSSWKAEDFFTCDM